MQRAQKRAERGVSGKAESEYWREWRERGSREDVPAKRTWKRTCVRNARGLRSGRGLRGTRVEKRTLHERHVLARHERHERREAVELRVDALQGSRNSFPVFFSFGFMCKCLWEAPVGDIVESFKCCRVPRIRVYFYTALSFVCL